MKTSIDLTENNDFNGKVKSVVNDLKLNIMEKIRKHFNSEYRSMFLFGNNKRMYFLKNDIVGANEFKAISDVLIKPAGFIRSEIDKMNNSTVRFNRYNNYNNSSTTSGIAELTNDYNSNETTSVSTELLYQYNPMRNHCIRCNKQIPLNYPWGKYRELCKSCEEEIIKNENSFSYVLPINEKVKVKLFKDL